LPHAFEIRQESVALFAAMLVALLVCQTRSAQSGSANPSDTSAKPLLLEKNEGEMRLWRPEPGETDPGGFTVKVSPKNNGSQHLVRTTGEVAPGGVIPQHKHLQQYEIVLIEKGTIHAHVGDEVRDLHAGGMVFIPAFTWVSRKNPGNETASVVAIFSSPGFEDHMRSESVLANEKPTIISRAEENECDRLGHVVHRDRGEEELQN
jgi:quercetin dioxygenase-like cupin family protein